MNIYIHIYIICYYIFTCYVILFSVYFIQGIWYHAKLWVLSVSHTLFLKYSLHNILFYQIKQVVFFTCISLFLWDNRKTLNMNMNSLCLSLFLTVNVWFVSLSQVHHYSSPLLSSDEILPFVPQSISPSSFFSSSSYHSSCLLLLTSGICKIY